MIGSGGEKDEDDYDKYLYLLQEDYEAQRIEQALKELLRERGAKTGALNKRQREERVKVVQSAADKLWAKDPSLSKKAVAREILRGHPNWSLGTTTRMIRKPSAD